MSESKLPSGWASTAIDEVTDRDVDQGAPYSDTFTYLDIGCVDNARKQIVAPKVVRKSEAPSRARQRLRVGDVLVSMTRPNLNAVALVPTSLQGSIGSTGFHVLRSKLIDPKWLHFLVQTTGFVEAMSSLVQGALYPAVRPKDIRSYRIPIAPLPEQKRIVAEIEKQFTRLDAGVEALKRLQTHLKRYRASVLKAACEGKLVPTEAELARKEGRDYEPADKLLKRILKERRAKWEADQLAKMKAAGKTPKDDRWKAKYKEPARVDERPATPLPEGWTWAKWSQIGFSQNGRPFPSSEYQDVGVKLLRPGNLHVSGLVRWDADNTRCLPEHFAGENPDLLIAGGELVMNLTAQSLKDEFLGRVCVTGDGERCLLNQRLARLMPVGVSERFCLWMLKSWSFRRFVDGLNKGSLIQHMFTSQLDNFVVALPPAKEQLRIVSEVEKRVSTIAQVEDAIRNGIRRASRLRQSILKRAFEGKLVPQDPNDESASDLLERIRASAANRPDKAAKPRSPKSKSKTAAI